MTRSLKLTALVIAIGLLPLLIVGVLIAQRQNDHAAVDSALVSRAGVQATELEAGFARGRTIALLMSSNPSFGGFYSQPGTRVAKVAAEGPTIAHVHNALAYLETLYPGQIGEACFIDRGGLENARVVRGEVHPRRGSRTSRRTPSSSPRSGRPPVPSTNRRPTSRPTRVSG